MPDIVVRQSTGSRKLKSKANADAVREAYKRGRVKIRVQLLAKFPGIEGQSLDRSYVVECLNADAADYFREQFRLLMKQVDGINVISTKAKVCAPVSDQATAAA